MIFTLGGWKRNIWNCATPSFSTPPTLLPTALRLMLCIWTEKNSAKCKLLHSGIGVIVENDAVWVIPAKVTICRLFKGGWNWSGLFESRPLPCRCHRIDLTPTSALVANGVFFRRSWEMTGHGNIFKIDCHILIEMCFLCKTRCLPENKHSSLLCIFRNNPT